MTAKRPPSRPFSRRSFLRASGAAAGLAAAAGFPRAAWGQGAGPALVTPDPRRPAIPFGVQAGDLADGRAIVWSRTDRPARLIVEWATSDRFRGARRVVGPAALDEDDFTARVDLADLPGGQHIFYRVTFQDLADLRSLSAPVVGSFRTPPSGQRDILFAWSGDTAGQGWGINPDWGGMKIYEAMRRLDPDFFIHCGDQVYADNPILAEVRHEDGTVWRNVTTPAKAKVAETLSEFRGNFAYNLLDENVRRFNAQVPSLVRWDDHEVRNNWFPGLMLVDDARYTVKSASLLAARARRAMFEYTPMQSNPQDSERIYRAYRYGPSLEVFLLDERSYRGPNTPNRQASPGGDAAFLGTAQMRWLKAALLGSRATWKVIASDMPLALVVRDVVREGRTTYEAWANGDDGPPLGRELELADLLGFIARNGIANVVWLTADVHYAAAHRYDPGRARFTDFTPFWEFVAGPLNAGTFGPNDLDATFGPQVVFSNVAKGMKPNRPPTAGLQSFGTVRIEGATEAMTVALHGLDGAALYRVTLPPEPSD